jgi:hypothetical protein
MKQCPEDWGNEKTSGEKNWENKNWEIREVHAGRPVERAVGAVEMHLRLNMDFQAAGQEGSAERAVFVTVVKVHVYEALSY